MATMKLNEILLFLVFIMWYCNRCLRQNLSSYTIQEFAYLDQLDSTLPLYGPQKVERSLQSSPKWFQDYVEWHSEQRKKASLNPNYEINYLVASCVKGTKCGGIADRMRSLPFFLMLAAKTNRVLLIKWTKPHDLREFLVPPDRGLDWTPTQELDIISANGEQNDGSAWTGCRRGGKRLFGMEVLNVCTDTLKASKKQYFFLYVFRARANFESMNTAFNEYTYETKKDKVAWVDATGSMFRVLFEPAPPLAESIETKMNVLGLNEYQYLSVHLRTKYLYEKNSVLNFDEDEEVRNSTLNLARNALQCISSVSKEFPIFMASDNNHTSAYIIKNSTDFIDKQKLVTILRDEEPLNIDNDDITESVPSDFFSTFEDLLIMGGSRCVAYGIGNFGPFGSGLIDNRCFAIHQDNEGNIQECSIKDSTGTNVHN